MIEFGHISKKGSNDVMDDEQHELNRVLSRYRRGRCEAGYTAQLVEGLILKLDQGGKERVLSSLWLELSADFRKAAIGEPVQNWIFPVTIPCWVMLGDTSVMTRRLLSMLAPNEPSVAKAWTAHLSGFLSDALYHHYNRFTQSAIAEIEAWVAEQKFAIDAGVDDYQLEPALVRAINRISDIIEDKHSEPRDQALLAASGAACRQRKLPVVAASRLDGKDELSSLYKSDAFISHASEDKESFVTPLYEELKKYGLEIWFDKFTLKVGDSLRESVEAGLATSRFGIVILSPSFFAKNWPQSELNGLFAREMEGQKVILPVWHQITKQDLLQKAPMLVDKKAANSKDGIAAVARELVEVIRPEALELDVSRMDAQRVNARLLEQLREKNPVLDFKVSFGPTPFPGKLPSTPSFPGVIASESHSGMQIDVLARNREQYLKNPIKFSIGFRDKGGEKFLEFIRTGKAQEFTGDEFINVKTNLELFAPTDADAAGKKLLLMPSMHTKKTVPVRVTFTGGSNTVQFPYLQMRGERGGTDEVSTVIEGHNVPFLLRVILPRHETGGANFEIEPRIIGAEIHALQKYTRALSTMQEGGSIEVVHLETDSLIFLGHSKLDASTEKQDWWFRMVDDVVTVAEHFGLTVNWPATISERDAELLSFLKCFINGTPVGKGASFTSVLKKTQDNARLFEAPPSGPVWLQEEDPIVFFGTPIRDRALFLFMEQVQIVDFDAVRDRFARAAPGDEIDIRYRTDSELLVRVLDKNNARLVEQSAAPHSATDHMK